MCLETGFWKRFINPHSSLNLPTAKSLLKLRKELPVFYKGQKLETSYRADVICYRQIIVELKALDKLTSKEESQLLNYLSATGLRVGLLINFGSRGKLEWKRFVN